MKRKVLCAAVVTIAALSMLFVAACTNVIQNDKINGRTVLVKAAAGLEVTINVETYSAVGGNATGNFSGTIKNTGADVAKNWSLEFDWAGATITSSWGASYGRTGDHYMLTPPDWSRNLASGTELKFGGEVTFAGEEKTTPTNVITKQDGPGNTTGLPAGPLTEVAYVYRTIAETDTTFTGELLVGNVNKTWVWNSGVFTLKDISVTCSSQITEIKTPNGIIDFNQTGDTLTIKPEWQSILDLNSTLEFSIKGVKSGSNPIPGAVVPNYQRNDAIVYPEYADLPASWSKNKTDLSAADLIADSGRYYDQNITPVTDTMILYNPPNPTQLQIGQVMAMDYVVNVEKEVRIHIPGEYMAMGLGLVQEMVKINPNYMVGLGTKENFAAGFVHHANTGDPKNFHPVTIDNVLYYWPIKLHVDGPYQQEVGNFGDMVKYFPDYFLPDSDHPEYTAITIDRKDPNWISSALCSGLSITTTRETLFTVPADFTGLLDQAQDPWAEMSIVTFAYNRGIHAFYAKELFTANRQRAINADNISTEFDMGGFASHVPTVKAITQACNYSGDIYDGKIYWADMEVFFTQLNEFFRRPVITDAEWDAMVADVKRAFDVLKAHWGGEYCSVRYDFLTLLRVAKKYLPTPTVPRPTGQDWYYLIKNSPFGENAASYTGPTPTPLPAGSTHVWTVGTTYTTGTLVTYNGSTYKCVQTHTATAGWEPNVVTTLWVVQ